MKKKYMSLYILDSVITFSIASLFLILNFVKVEGSVFNFVNYLSNHYFTVVLIVLSIATFIVFILLNRKKYTLEVDNLLMPIAYLVFTCILILGAFLLNNYVVIKNMHFVYLYRFIIFDYLLLSSYTILSFKK